jgi:protein-L-isoaspartate O-methyltransferase
MCRTLFEACSATSSSRPLHGRAPNEAEPHRIDREHNPDAWWDAVYRDAPIITQLDGGATDAGTGEGDHTSSCSAPSTVASLLELADLDQGHRVLEIGTGTGWTTALTSHIVGESDGT